MVLVQSSRNVSCVVEERVGPVDLFVNADSNFHVGAQFIFSVHVNLYFLFLIIFPSRSPVYSDKPLRGIIILHHPHIRG